MKHIKFLTPVLLLTACGNSNTPTHIEERAAAGAVSQLTLPLDQTDPAHKQISKVVLEISSDAGFTQATVVEGVIHEGKVTFDLSKVTAPKTTNLPPERVRDLFWANTGQCNSQVQTSKGDLSINGYTRFKIHYTGLSPVVGVLQKSTTTQGEKEDTQTGVGTSLMFASGSVRILGKQNCSYTTSGFQINTNIDLDVQLQTGWNLVRFQSNTVLPHNGDHKPLGMTMNVKLQDSSDLAGLTLRKN